jgi:hypothetical protein
MAGSPDQEVVAARALRDAAEWAYEILSGPIEGVELAEWAAMVVEVLPPNLHAACLRQVLPDWLELYAAGRHDEFEPEPGE